MNGDVVDWLVVPVASIAVAVFLPMLSHLLMFLVPVNNKKYEDFSTASKCFRISFPFHRIKTSKYFNGTIGMQLT